MKATFEIDVTDQKQVDTLVEYLTRKPKATATKKEAAAKPETNSVTPETPKPVSGITLPALRALTSSKVQKHREVITEKLAEYGVENVTKIPQEKFEDYKKFLEGLD